MTDARFGSDELHRPDVWELSDRAWRVMVSARAWCAGAGTDGRLRTAYLHLVYPGGVSGEIAMELVAAGHRRPADDGDGYPVDWARQSTAAEVEAQRARKRANQRAWRQRQRERLADAVAGNETTPVTTRVTGHVAGQVGKARPGPLVSVPPPPPVPGGGGGGTGADLTRVRAREDDPPQEPRPGPTTHAAPAAPTTGRAAASGTGSPPARPTPGTTPSNRSSARPPDWFGAAARTHVTAGNARRLPTARVGGLRLVTSPAPRRATAPDDPWRQLALPLFVGPEPWQPWATSPNTPPGGLPTLDQITAAAYATA